VFLEQDRGFDFDVALDLFETDIHDCATNLDDPCLVRFQFQMVLDLDQGAKLGHVVLEDELAVFELDCSVGSRHTDVADFNLLVITSA